MNTRKKLALPIAVVAITMGAANAFGGLSLTNIPTLGADVSNEGRCMTPDSKYIGGLSGTAAGFFYDVANNAVFQPSSGSPAAKAVSGICYRLDTNQSPAQLQIILDTESAGWRAYFMTPDFGVTWRRQLLNPDPVNNVYAYSIYGGLPGQNSLAGTTAGDVFISTFRNSGRSAVYALYNSNLWDGATSPQYVGINKSVPSGATVDILGVAATGRIVGRRTDADTIMRNTLWDWKPASSTQYQWNGLDGTTYGQAWSVSQDGNVIFGWSHTLADAVNNYNYKTVLSGSGTAATPPGSGITQVSVDPLPEHPRTGGSTTRGVPFGCTADGKYAVGYMYTKITQAALWDTSDPSPANWKITDLNQLAADYGLGVPNVFSCLERGYAVATNAAGDIVITGRGVEAGTGQYRAFIMTIPPSIAAAGYVSPKLTMTGTYPGPLTFTYFGALNTTTYLEYTSDLTPTPTWTILDTQQNLSGTTVVQYTSTDITPDPNLRFYRLRVVNN
jgi:hypothetical protein